MPIQHRKERRLGAAVWQVEHRGVRILLQQTSQIDGHNGKGLRAPSRYVVTGQRRQPAEECGRLWANAEQPGAAEQHPAAPAGPYHVCPPALHGRDAEAVRVVFALVCLLQTRPQPDPVAALSRDTQMCELLPTLPARAGAPKP